MSDRVLLLAMILTFVVLIGFTVKTVMFFFEVLR
jgi:hypothetical protein